MRRASSLGFGGLLLLLSQPQSVAGIIVELSEIQQIDDTFASGAFDRTQTFGTGVDLVDTDCPAAGKCTGLLTRDGSLDLDSRYGCSEPPEPFSGDDDGPPENVCDVEYRFATAGGNTATIASVSIAFHPDSTRTLNLLVNADTDIGQWEAAPDTTELQEIPGLEGLEVSSLLLGGVFGAGDYLGILETEIYVVVDEVATVGTSASTRTTISATSTTDTSSAMNTVDGDATDSAAWICSAGEVCEMTYDLQATESLEQLRIAFSESSAAGGVLHFMTAGESGVFSTVRTDIEAGGRPVGSDGFQTFGGVRALARYVKIEVIPPSGGSIVINEVEFRVGGDAPTRPVEEKKWLKPTGPLPLAHDYMSSEDELNYDSRLPADGGCDSPSHFEGCHPYYVKDGDMSSRWSCGPLAVGAYGTEECELGMDLNHFRYVRQIQIAFDMGDEQHDEFRVEALTAQGWMTVVASAISSGDTADYQTFNVAVHASEIVVVPKFQQLNQWFSISESLRAMHTVAGMDNVSVSEALLTYGRSHLTQTSTDSKANNIVILEERRNDFIAGTVPVFEFTGPFEFDSDDQASQVEIPTRFSFDIPRADDRVYINMEGATVTALRMRFPADRQFVFEVDADNDPEIFTSAGGGNVWETFTLSEPVVVHGSIEITAVSGPTFANKPDYPALRVVDFQVVGELENNGPGYFKMMTTTTPEWRGVPDIIGDGVSEQEEIMTLICETKGATFDGTDCLGELDDSTVHIEFELGEYFLDGPIFIKSGVTLQGKYSSEFSFYTEFVLYDGTNNENTAEEAMIVIDNVTGATVTKIDMLRKTDWTGDIVPNTLGNLCLDVRNSKDIEFDDVAPRECRTGAARFTDSSNINTFLFLESRQETGNYMELTRVDDFIVRGFGDVRGLLIDTCNNVTWGGHDGDGYTSPNPRILPPFGGEQVASVVVTGDSSNVVFKECYMGPGAEPRILMESTTPLTLENIFSYEEAQSGDCIVQVPEGTTEDFIVQVDSEQTLSKSGDCWILD